MSQASPPDSSQRQSLLLEEAAKYTPIGLLEFDAQHKLAWNNSAAESILGAGLFLDPGTPVAQIFEDLHAMCKDADNNRAVVETTSSMPDLVYTDFLELEDGRAIERMTFPSTSRDGHRIWRLRDVTLIRNFFSTSAMTASYMEDHANEQIQIAEQLHMTNLELAEAKKELEILASTDQLTGLPNRRSFFMEADVYTNFGRKDRPIVMLMVDIDHFKSVNDTWGHACGDEAIRLLANTIKHELRPSDIVARMGGEEYAAILKDCDMEKAQELAETIRQRIEESVLEFEGNRISMTASLGLAAHNISDRASTEFALDLADQALYQAKEGGRNRVAVYSDGNKPQ